MNDLFNEPDTIRNAGFADFWSIIPQGAKTGKREAEKAWRKLKAAERKAADESAVAYYAWWRSANPQASWLHPSTYLNQRRWEDEAWRPAAPSQQVDRAAFWAESIKGGKYVSPATCPPQLCREMIERGLVTERQVLEKGLSI